MIKTKKVAASLDTEAKEVYNMKLIFIFNFNGDSMKKAIVFLLFTALLLSLAPALTGCATSQQWEDDGRIRVLSTIFPPYDMARAIGGEAVDARMLIRPGNNMHSYEPTASDTILIQECDIFLYVGGESDAWVSELLSSIDTEGMILISLAEIAVTLHEEAHEAHEHTEDCEDEHAHDHDIGYDEHVWTSFENAAAIATAIQNALCSYAPNHSSAFDENTENYLKELNTIRTEYESVIQSASQKTLLFGDRFPFLYLAKEMGLSYIAAFSGCSTTTEPSVSHLIHLIEEAREARATVVLYTETSENSHKTADRIADEIGAETAMLHSGHSLSRKEFEDGVTYFDLLRQNLAVIQEALNP